MTWFFWYSKEFYHMLIFVIPHILYLHCSCAKNFAWEYSAKLGKTCQKFCSTCVLVILLLLSPHKSCEVSELSLLICLKLASIFLIGVYRQLIFNSMNHFPIVVIFFVVVCSWLIFHFGIIISIVHFYLKSVSQMFLSFKIFAQHLPQLIFLSLFLSIVLSLSKIF